MLGQESAGSQSSIDPGGTSSKGSEVACSSYKRSKISRFESSGGKRQQVCKYFLNKQDCPFGDKCRYRHSALSTSSVSTDGPTPVVDHIVKNDPVSTHINPNPPSPGDQASSRKPRQRHVPICHFYLKSTCKYGSKCRYRHPKSSSHVPSSSSSSTVRSDDGHRGHASGPRDSSQKSSEKLSLGAFMKPVDKPPLQQGQKQKSKKTTNTSDLREVELAQILVQFSEEQCVLVEKGSHGVVYRITVYPTDPEWELDAVDMLITFPSEYPLEPLAVNVPSDQKLPSEFSTHLGEVITDHLLSMERAPGELMFQPFLKWLEENIVSIFQGMPSAVEDNDKEDTDHDSEDESEIDDEESESKSSGDEDDVSPDEETSPLQMLPTKRGTEVRLHGFQLSSAVGTVAVPNAKLVVSCTRCKAQCDVTMSAEKTVTNACLRCHSTFSVSYHPALLHAGSTTVGYMDMLGCTAVDFVLLSSDVIVTCLECGRENSSKGLSYGQPMFTWCRKCHSKLTVFTEQCKFIQHQPGSLLVASLGDGSSVRKSKKKVDEGIKEGYPLPETGTCQHYKKSHRWLRFPCCGKVYPCDVCHDSTEDHPMERANRMVCGFCSKEQPYSGTKPCVMCSSDLTSSKQTTYWEGGQGCRNKSKMNRNDRHKYQSSQNKTASKKSERVGARGKAKRAEN